MYQGVKMIMIKVPEILLLLVASNDIIDSCELLRRSKYESPAEDFYPPGSI